jgi:hypothetical protein
MTQLGQMLKGTGTEKKQKKQKKTKKQRALRFTGTSTWPGYSAGQSSGSGVRIPKLFTAYS